MHSLSADEKLAFMLPFLVKAKLVGDPTSPEQLATVRRVIEASGDRLKVGGDILAYADFFLVDKMPLDESAVKQRLAKPGVRDLVASYTAAIRGVEPFEPGPLEEALKRVVEAAGLKVGDLVHAVRVAITGKTVGPGLYDCLAILGREKSLARLEQSLPLCG